MDSFQLWESQPTLLFANYGFVITYFFFLLSTSFWQADVSYKTITDYNEVLKNCPSPKVCQHRPPWCQQLQNTSWVITTIPQCACNMETKVGWSPFQGGDYHQVIASKIIEQVLQLMKLKTHITPNQSNFIGKDENENEWVSNTPIHVGKHTRILTLCDFFSH